MRRRRFLCGEEGGITVLSLFMFILLLCVGGFALDVNNAVRARVQLQGATDAAAHAAITWRYRHDAGAATRKGIEIAEANMPGAIFGTVLAAVDVEFGTWDDAAHSFIPDTAATTAVRVTGRRSAAGANGVTTFLLGIVGQPVLDIHTRSVWLRRDGWCPPEGGEGYGEGFYALGRIEFQSGNDFGGGFCVHSQSWVELRQRNSFAPGTTVSMPDSADLVIPASGLQQNDGLEAALKSQHVNLGQFFDELPGLAAAYGDPMSAVQPPYVTEPVVEDVHSSVATMALLTPGAVNRVFCGGPRLQIDGVLRNLVLITDCPVQFRSGAALENATLVVEDTGPDAVRAASGLRLGAEDYCDTETGGAMVLALGDITTAANFEAYGAHMVALGNVSIAANADALAGINVMAGGTIDMTSGGSLGVCPEGPSADLSTPVFAMVQ